MTDGSQTRLAGSAADRRLLTLCLLAVVIGLAAGYAAFALYSLIAFVSNLVFYHQVSATLVSPLHHVIGPWVAIVPAIGGLVVGAMAKWGSPKIRGHGIPEAMEAVLMEQSRIAPRVALLKPLSAAISIGTGGPFGAEGPIIQTGGALGSLVGQLLHTTAAERKVLLACGAAAGMAATFNTPIAGVILAIELLLFEFRARSFIPLVIASTLATTVHVALLGPGAMFKVGVPHFGMPEALPWYLVLGVIAGFAAVLLTRALYFVEDAFEKLPFDEMWWPVIGGLAVGIIGFFVPRVLGVGYDTITDILNGRLLIGALLAVMVFKTAALLLSLGSGTSGGLLAPVLMGGAALGGLFASVMNAVVPGVHLDPAAFAVVGMAAVFGAASRATFTFIIFAFEITRRYEAVLPLMLVCVVADAIGLLFMRHSIMTEKLARRGLSVNAEYETDPLWHVAVKEVMDPPDAVTMLEGVEPLVVCHPDEPVHDAATRMLQTGVDRLPVVERGGTSVVGFLNPGGVMRARLHRIHDEHEREPGWLKLQRFARAPKRAPGAPSGNGGRG